MELSPNRIYDVVIERIAANGTQQPTDTLQYLPPSVFAQRPTDCSARLVSSALPAGGHIAEVGSHRLHSWERHNVIGLIKLVKGVLTRAS